MSYMKKILISGGFKNATQTLLHTFINLVGENVKKTHDYPWEKNFDEWDNEIIVVPFRNNSTKFL